MNGWPRGTLRPARADEGPALSALAFDAKAALGYSATQLGRWRDQDLRVDPAAAPAGTVWVAEDEQGLAGMAAWLPRGDGAELDHLWVQPGRQRQRWGRLLLALVAEQLLRRRLPWLHIDAEPQAARFYLRCGAQPAGSVAAPIDGQPQRTRPQFVLPLAMPRYTALEIERRWHCHAPALPTFDEGQGRLIEDLYLAPGRLRLRRVTLADGSQQHKLGRKQAALLGLLRPASNLYPDAAEWQALAALPGTAVRKRRHALAGGSLDVFESPASPPVFEREFDSVSDAAAFQPPAFVADEIDPAT